MASWNSTVEGLGFEEVNQAGQTEIISGTNVYGTTGSFANINVTTQNANLVSGATVVGNTISGATFRATGTGTISSVQIGSATAQLYGGIIKAGSALTDAGSQGFIKLGTAFAGGATGWYAQLTPTGSVTNYFCYISGARHASGVNFVGGESQRYDWIAIGI